MQEAVNNELKKRDEIEEQYKWQLSDLFADEAEWAAACERIREELKEVALYEATMLDSPAKLCHCLTWRDGIEVRLSKIYNYADLRLYAERNSTDNQILTGRANKLSDEVHQTLGPIESTLMALSIDEINELSKCPELEGYRFYLEELSQKKRHSLSKEKEGLMAKLHPVFNTAADMYSMLVTADSKPPTYTDSSGQEYQLTPTVMAELRIRLPKEEYIKLLPLTIEKYDTNKNTIATAFNAQIQKNITIASLRNYSEPREMLMQGIPTVINDNLIKTVRENVVLLERYQEIRKKVFGVSKLDSYDLAIPIVQSIDRYVSYEESKETIAQALAPLGRDLVNYFHYLTDCGSIDLYENQGKESGAFCCSIYDEHPYILLNFQHRLSDITTLAHESGHAFHSYLANKKQPFIYTTGTRFTGEIPSLTNEILLLEYFLNHTKSREEQIYWLDSYIGKFRHVLFNLTKVAEFEKTIYDRALEGQILTADLLGKIWETLVNDYREIEPETDFDVNVSWARYSLILTSPFYIYQYSTSFCAAVDIARRILYGTESDLHGYLEMLSGGSSDTAPNIIGKGGIDIMSTGYIKNALCVLEELLDKAEETFY